MGDFTEFGIEIERHLSKLGKDIQQFVEKVVPLANEDKDFAPDCDIIESEDEFKILIDLPGLSKKEIGIALKNSVLTIKGEREITAGDGEEFKRQERKRGAFARSFAVPQDVNAAEISASFRNGVLTVAMPKSEALKDSQSIPVN
ncbi:Hsp20/alpha crystallin family protein [Gracilimonas mengyeensis]|uniref:HSP20 family protein n=1 Tax=Gracilimonas mengyeensis TaxID=1302730 RepID=A0A521E2T8_9BACT|nr:Hsp20/alpha crystallin family protein [Gracilimonas mengyeensis]SMO78277.1 HSP20 family protein [Gracilimonas mengyeensis]